MAIDLPTIGRRLADQLRSPSITSAGLRQAYYPAPASFSESPAALVFAGPYSIATGGEEVWTGEHRVQLMIPAQGRLAAEINALEPLIAPIIDHFAPGTSAYTLRSPGEAGHVHRCFPDRLELSQSIEYAGHVYTATTLIFGIKFIRPIGG